jgi:hypothetical protein
VDNFVMRADFRDTIEAPWTKMDPVRIGPVPPGLPTPAAFVTVEENDSPLLRIDLFPQAEATAYAFREALVWRDFVVIGFGSQLHLISPSTRTVETLGLTDYFGNLYPLPDCLLVADAKFLRRVNTNGSVAWLSRLTSMGPLFLTCIPPPGSCTTRLSLSASAEVRLSSRKSSGAGV